MRTRSFCAGEEQNKPPECLVSHCSTPPLSGCLSSPPDFAAYPFVQRSWEIVQPDPPFCHKPRHMCERHLRWSGGPFTTAVHATVPRTSVPWNRQAGSARSWVFLNPCWQIPPPCLQILHVFLLRGSIAPRSLCFTMFAFLPKSRSSGRQSPQRGFWVCEACPARPKRC